MQISPRAINSFHLNIKLPLALPSPLGEREGRGAETPLAKRVKILLPGVIILEGEKTRRRESEKWHWFVFKRMATFSGSR
jgi:hypothetical protein